MKIGHNQNIPYEGKLYHVQTEDVEDRLEVVTQVFLDGRIIHTYRVSYQPWQHEIGWQEKVAQQAKKQHTLMAAAVMRGRLAAKTQ